MTQHIPGELIGNIMQFLLGGWLTSYQNYTKGSMGYLGGKNNCWVCTMHNPDWILATGIVQNVILIGSECRLRDCIAQCFGPVVIVSQKCAKIILEYSSK